MICHTYIWRDAGGFDNENWIPLLRLKMRNWSCVGSGMSDLN
jgi:hypothetical protein